MVYNIDEILVYELARNIPGCYARLATAEEDCGYHHADVVLDYQGQRFYVQVSHTPKSGQEQRRLKGRGTHAIYTHRFAGMPLPKEEIIGNLERILGRGF